MTERQEFIKQIAFNSVQEFIENNSINELNKEKSTWNKRINYQIINDKRINKYVDNLTELSYKRFRNKIYKRINQVIDRKKLINN